MHRTSQHIGLLALAVILAITGLFPLGLGASQAAAPYDDLTPNQLTFSGRRGVSYTASWDPATYEFNFSTPDGTFPWDWISFVGKAGSISLNGLANVGQTLAMSDPAALNGAQPGDLMRIKGQGILGMAHLTKIGLVIGSGAGAQRGWFSSGVIDRYTVAPHFVGYRVHLLGRTATVRLTSLTPANFSSVAVIEVALDNPANARLVLASDLEPAMDYAYAVEFHNRTDTRLAFDSANQAIKGTRGASSDPVYVYSNQPLHSWSGSNQTFNQYLAADSLDGQLAGSGSDGRVALSTSAQPMQYFFIGSQLLPGATRSDPSADWNALRSGRLNQLSQLPVVDSLAMPRFKFVNLLSNLILVSLINPGGGLFYTDKSVIYLPDAVMPLLVTPHLLPAAMLANYEQGLVKIAASQWTAPVSGKYGYRVDTQSWPSLPGAYGGNFPDLIHYQPGGSRQHRENYSDAYATAEFINSVAQLYRVTGNPAYAHSVEPNVSAALAALQAFDQSYDAQHGQDGNLFPNLLVPMSDLGQAAGEYPGESGQAIYAYEDAEMLLRLYGRDVEAGQLANSYIAPMKAAFDSHFWDASAHFYLPVADDNSVHQPAGAKVNDLWAHTAFIPLRGDVGQARLAQMLAVLTGPAFLEPENDMHWLAKGSDNFATSGRWGLSASYTNGWGMEGGYLVLPNAIPALGYFQIGQNTLATNYANIYFDKWMQYGPHETGMEWAGQMPGKFGESSLYIEAAAATTWLLQSALGLDFNGSQVTLQPKLPGQFVVRNLRLTSQGKTAVLNYARDASGKESVQVVSNTGLILLTPSIVGTTPPTQTTFLPTVTGTATTQPAQTTAPPVAATFTPTQTTYLPTVANTFTSTPSGTQVLSSGDTLYLSSNNFGAVGGVSFSDEDILSHDLSSGAWSKLFDGSDVGLGGTNMDVDGFFRLADGSLLLSLESGASLPGVGWVDGADIVRFYPTSLGENTSGNYEIYFDGSDVGLDTNSENIDAIAFTHDGRLVISVIGSFSAGAVAGNDEDLFAFTAAQLGSVTSGSWELYFDGSDVGLSTTSDEDINAAWIDPASGKLYLSTLGPFAVAGASGDGADVFTCTPASLGSTTACTYGPGLYWDGSASGFSGQVIDGLSLDLGTPGATATPTPTPIRTVTPDPTVSFTPTHTPTPTATNAPTATRTVTPSPTVIPTPTTTPTPIPTFTPQPGAGDLLYLSSTTGGTAGGVVFEDEDILTYQTASGAWSMYFDGSDVGLGSSDVNAFHRLTDGSLLLSVLPMSIPGVGYVDDSDVLRFVPVATGDATDGRFEMYLDGSDVGLDVNSEAIDGLSMAPDGRLVISVVGSFTAGSASGYDEDLFAFNATQLGSNTSGSWELYFDGSDVGLSTTADEDINAFWIDPANGKIFLNTLGAFSVAGVSGDGSDIFICTPSSLGGVTACTFGPGLYWQGAANGFAGEDVDGLGVASPAPNNPAPTACPAGPVRIMPLGASFTQGYGSTNLNGYRRRLYLLLKTAGYQVDFVGSLQDGLNDFDRDHEGHPGWHAEGGSEGGVALYVYDWLTANPADVVLLHVGTNDISNGDQDPAEIAHILDEIDRYDPNITVVLALLINRKTYSPETTQFNQDVQAMAQARIANGDKIVIVDMEHALIYPDDMYDNVHPNDTGYNKAAAVWFSGLQSFLPVCR